MWISFFSLWSSKTHLLWLGMTLCSKMITYPEYATRLISSLPKIYRKRNKNVKCPAVKWIMAAAFFNFRKDMTRIWERNSNFSVKRRKGSPRYVFSIEDINPGEIHSRQIKWGAPEGDRACLHFLRFTPHQSPFNYIVKSSFYKWRNSGCTFSSWLEPTQLSQAEPRQKIQDATVLREHSQVCWYAVIPALGR